MIDYQYSMKDQGYVVLAICDRCKVDEFQLARYDDFKPGAILQNYAGLTSQGWKMDGPRLYCPRCVAELAEPRA